MDVTERKVPTHCSFAPEFYTMSKTGKFNSNCRTTSHGRSSPDINAEKAQAELAASNVQGTERANQKAAAVMRGNQNIYTMTQQHRNLKQHLTETVTCQLC